MISIMWKFAHDRRLAAEIRLNMEVVMKYIHSVDRGRAFCRTPTRFLSNSLSVALSVELASTVFTWMPVAMKDNGFLCF
jgi:hypothetical protein